MYFLFFCGDEMNVLYSSLIMFFFIYFVIVTDFMVPIYIYGIVNLLPVNHFEHRPGN